MLNKQVSTSKRIVSDIILTCSQLFKKSSAFFFILLFLTYFLCPIDDFANRKFIFASFFNGSTFYSYLAAISILFIVALVHFFYTVNLTICFQNINFKTLLSTNESKLLSGIFLMFLTFLAYFLSFKFLNNSSLKFSNLWLYVFFNYLKLFIAYIIVAFGTIVLIDLNNLKDHFKGFSIKRFIFIVIKVSFALILINLILSPFFYCLQNQLSFSNPFSNKLDILPWICYIIECLLNTIIVMFFYNYIELLIHNKEREIVHRRYFKKISLIVLSFLYLFIWFTCGVIYQSIARQSNGRNFIFQEDIKIKLQAKAFKDLTNMNVDEYTICDLIKYNEFEKNVIYFKKNNGLVNFTSSNSSTNLNIDRDFNFDEPEGSLFLGGIGKYWGEFYCSDFYCNGISNYRFEVKDSINSPKDIVLNNEKLYPVTIFLYKAKVKNTDSNLPDSDRITLLDSSEDINNYSLVHQYTILIDDPSYISVLKNSQGTSGNQHNPMYSNLTNMLQHSIVFINYNYKMMTDTFNRIETEGVRVPLLDFLYYSAVTITTTGYGDILPNSTIVRTLVMFETFFGVGIPGFIISLLFLKVEHKKNI